MKYKQSVWVSPSNEKELSLKMEDKVEGLEENLNNLLQFVKEYPLWLTVGQGSWWVLPFLLPHTNQPTTFSLTEPTIPPHHPQHHLHPRETLWRKRTSPVRQRYNARLSYPHPFLFLFTQQFIPVGHLSEQEHTLAKYHPQRGGG